MPKTFERWTVLPHGKLTRIEENILTVVGDIQMPLTHFPRRMTVVRLGDGRLVIYSAIALDADEMVALQEYGLPAYLIVPGDTHRMDAKIWKDRFPNMLVIAPEGARKRVEEVVHVDSSSVDFRDTRVRLVSVPGTNGHEAALVVENPTGTTLIVNHLIGNLDDRRGIRGWLLRAMGFTGEEPRITKLSERTLIKDKSAVRAQLESWAGLRSLKRIIVSHGAPIERDPGGALRKLATSLAA
jgi:hypothetical protein